jgi:hypothetical protein
MVRVFDGFSFMLRHPGAALLVALLLSMLGSPLGLALRRRHLEALAGDVA